MKTKKDHFGGVSDITVSKLTEWYFSQLNKTANQKHQINAVIKPDLATN